MCSSDLCEVVFKRLGSVLYSLCKAGSLREVVAMRELTVVIKSCFTFLDL